MITFIGGAGQFGWRRVVKLLAFCRYLDASLRERIFGGTGVVPRKWIATRNYYTHWDEASRNDVLDTPGMCYATVRLRHFLRVLYLNFAGIPQTAIVKSLDGTNKESQHLLQLNHPAATFGHVNVRHDSSPEPDAAEPHTGD
ncbi:MAG: hypothetical protein L0H70_07900 [Xanthomonadales bacterium]|nr:hypothetical protein [Xanthomonadales bacterium]